MTPLEVETAVFALEAVRILIRAPENSKLGDFQFVRKAADNASISEWLEQRILPITKGFPVVVIDGTGSIPRGQKKMSTLRQSYAK
jgi:hypothetical protein